MDIKEAQNVVRKFAENNGWKDEPNIGGLLFALLRLSNQLGVDAEKAFEKVSKSITNRYNGRQEWEKDKKELQ